MDNVVVTAAGAEFREFDLISPGAAPGRAGRRSIESSAPLGQCPGSSRPLDRSYMPFRLASPRRQLGASIRGDTGLFIYRSGPRWKFRCRSALLPGFDQP